MSQPQSIRFRRPDTGEPKPEKVKRHQGILQDQLRRAARPPWSPSFSLGFRILLLARFLSAMYSNIDDCDEVYNFWEPLHFFHQGSGFQTWETSPEFSIRSWAYILFHLPFANLGMLVSNGQKRAAFFGVRIFLAFVSTFAEVALYRNVYTKVNERVGRYLFFFLLFNAGMWNASTALLPSSFAMYTTTAAFAASIAPSSFRQPQRALYATLLFATGAIAGWPFSLALAIPFVIEELFIASGDRVPSSVMLSWMSGRWSRLFKAGAFASLILIPVVAVDTMAYGKLTVTSWNIVSYNLFGGDERGPNLYGTEPSTFYLRNLLLNFNILLPLALISIPGLVVTYAIDTRRLGPKVSADESSPFTVLAFKLAPFYLWLGILSAQEHKEERFMFPAYPLLCFNAAVSVYLIRGWMESVYVKITKSPYQASQTPLFSRFTASIVFFTCLLSVSRICANWYYYHAPLEIFYRFEAEEIKSLLNSTGLIVPPLAPLDADLGYHERRAEENREIDLTVVRELDLTLCLGKEWYRFPSHYLVPNGIRVEFIQSDSNGLLPGHFGEGDSVSVNVSDAIAEKSAWWPRPETRLIPVHQNDMNRAEPSHYVPVEQCDYLVDLDFPALPSSSTLEPRYAVDSDTWERVACAPFLDARYSPMLSRALWLPGEKWRALNAWGDYCLLRNKDLVANKQRVVRTTQKL